MALEFDTITPGVNIASICITTAGGWSIGKNIPLTFRSATAGKLPSISSSLGTMMNPTEKIALSTSLWSVAISMACLNITETTDGSIGNLLNGSLVPKYEANIITDSTSIDNNGNEYTTEGQILKYFLAFKALFYNITSSYVFNTSVKHYRTPILTNTDNSLPGAILFSINNPLSYNNKTYLGLIHGVRNDEGELINNLWYGNKVPVFENEIDLEPTLIGYFGIYIPVIRQKDGLSDTNAEQINTLAQKQYIQQKHVVFVAFKEAALGIGSVNPTVPTGNLSIRVLSSNMPDVGQTHNFTAVISLKITKPSDKHLGIKIQDNFSNGVTSDLTDTGQGYSTSTVTLTILGKLYVDDFRNGIDSALSIRPAGMTPNKYYADGKITFTYAGDSAEYFWSNAREYYQDPAY